MQILFCFFASCFYEDQLKCGYIQHVTCVCVCVCFLCLILELSTSQATVTFWVLLLSNHCSEGSLICRHCTGMVHNEHTVTVECVCAVAQRKTGTFAAQRAALCSIRDPVKCESWLGSSVTKIVVVGNSCWPAWWLQHYSGCFREVGLQFGCYFHW